MIRSITRQTPTINSYELVSPAGEPLPSFSAGAHLEIELAPGLRRHYSLANSPAERHRYLIAVLKEPAGRGGSRHLHDRARVGDLLEVSAPRNLFALGDSRSSVLLAGGVGITPLLSMAHALAEASRPFALHYCVRTERDVAFPEELAKLSAKGEVRVHPSREGAGRLDLHALASGLSPDTTLYCCGPAGLIAAAGAAAAAVGAPFRSEHFAPAAPAQPFEDGEFEVEIASTGLVLKVPANRSILDVLNAAGCSIDSSCEAGTCGTCQTRYLAGDVDHRDFVLSEAEQRDQLMVCVSRGRGRIVLDL